MAISVPIPKEITEYEEKIIFGLSLRKLVCLVSAILLGVGTYLLCTIVLGVSGDTTSYIIIIEAVPLMAIGFIKKDGMTFEQYAALWVRHRIGANKLAYETELVIDTLPNAATERKSKYAWIFEKESNTTSGQRQLSHRERREVRSRREADVFTVTKKGRKRKRKEALRTIKAARQEYQSVKRGAQKAAEESRRSEKHSSADKV